MATQDLEQLSIGLAANLAKYRADPSLMQQYILQYIEAATNGGTMVLDPTNPFVMLMEASCLNSSLFIQETQTLLKQQYPVLAQTYEDLFLHMSDRDYLDVFCKPAKTNMTFMFYANMFDQRAVRDEPNKCNKVIIPRNTEVTFEGTVFSLQYPIELRRYNNGVYQAMYVIDKESPIEAISESIIDTLYMPTSTTEAWIGFTIPMLQLASSSTELTIDPGGIFRKKIKFDNQYYSARIYQKYQGNWIEIKTTFTEQVYDPYVPTAVLKVIGGSLEIFIPPLYVNNNVISNIIRVDIFTSKGEISINAAEVTVPNGYVINYKYNDISDSSTYVSVLSTIPNYCFTSELIKGGSVGSDFAKLRDKVIYNSIGKQNLPMTNKNIEYYGDKLGYSVNKDLDYLTNRIFTISKELTNPSNDIILIKPNPTILTINYTLDEVNQLGFVFKNNNTYTIPSNRLVAYVNGVAKYKSAIEQTAIESLSKRLLCDALNNEHLTYSPYWYVLDAEQNDFEVRAYDLDTPKVINTVYEKENVNLQMKVGVAAISVTKETYGYLVRVKTKSDSFYKAIDSTFLGAQLSFSPDNSSSIVAIEGELLGTEPSTSERIFQFRLNTTHHIDRDDLINISNAYFDNGFGTTVYSPLTNNFTIAFYTTEVPADYTNATTANILNENITGLIVPVYFISQSKAKITLGYRLSGLWTRYRTYKRPAEYQTYAADVPKVYQTDVLAVNPDNGTNVFIVDGLPTFQLAHHAGDPVLDLAGNQVFEHLAGDTVLDENGDPVLLVSSASHVQRELDLLVVEAAFKYATTPAHVAYVTEYTREITNSIVNDVEYLQKNVLEQTNIYYKPLAIKGTAVATVGSNAIIAIDKQQSLNIDVYVNSLVYNNLTYRTSLKNSLLRAIQTELATGDISVSVLEYKLLTSITGCNGLKISNLGGSNNYEVLTLVNPNDKLSLQVEANVTEDNEIVVDFTANVNFLLHG